MDMKKIVLAMGMSAVMGVAVAAQMANTEKTGPKNDIKRAAESMDYDAMTKLHDAGQAIYGGSCIGCHGANLEGGIGPRLVPAEVKSKEEAKNIYANAVDKLKRYRAGEQLGSMTAMMAPNAASLSDDDIKAVSAYIATFAPLKEK